MPKVSRKVRRLSWPPKRTQQRRRSIVMQVSSRSEPTSATAAQAREMQRLLGPSDGFDGTSSRRTVARKSLHDRTLDEAWFSNAYRAAATEVSPAPVHAAQSWDEFWGAAIPEIMAQDAGAAAAPPEKDARSTANATIERLHAELSTARCESYELQRACSALSNEVRQRNDEIARQNALLLTMHRQSMQEVTRLAHELGQADKMIARG